MKNGVRPGIVFEFTELKGKQAIKGIVMSRKSHKEQINLGLQFKDIDDDVQTVIDTLVSHVSEHIGSRLPAALLPRLCITVTDRP